MRNRNLKKMLIISFSLPFFLFGTIFMVNAIGNAYDHYRLSSWTTTKGNLIFAAPSRSIPNVHYEYFVQGKRYESKCFTVLRTAGGATWAKEQVASLWRDNDTNEGISVMFDPNNPSSSVLYSKSLSTWMSLALSLVLFVVGGVFALEIFGIQERKGDGTSKATGTSDVIEEYD